MYIYEKLLFLIEIFTCILELMVYGKSHSEICETMDMRMGYVKSTIRQFVRKMGFVNTGDSELVDFSSVSLKEIRYKKKPI